MRLIKVSNSFVLKDFCTINTNFPDADFWLIRKGSEDKVGLPVRVFSDEHIGVRVDSSDLLDSGYLFYYLSYLNSVGYFKALSRGMSALQNIRVSDVKNIPISFG